MKKYNRLLIFTFISFFILNIPILAKEVTLNELGQEIEKYQKDANEALIIGNYVFTDAYKIGIQDVMLAANKSQSVISKSSETEYQNMAIHRLRVKYKDHKRDGWELVDNFLGDFKLKLDDKNKIDIRYIDYNFLSRTSTATINVGVDNEEYKTYQDVLKKALNFETSKFYGANSDGKNELKLDGNKLSGLLLKNKNVSLNDEDKKKYANADYFFAYILEVPNANTNTTIKITNLNGDTNIDWKDFDVKNEDDQDKSKTPGIVILTPINKEEFNNENAKKITIVVDVDGESDKEYSPTTYTIDLSELTFQEDSTATLGLDNASEQDKAIMNSWGYKAETNENLNLKKQDNSTLYKLKGNLVEQQLISDEAFGKDNVNGYYFDFTFEFPDRIDRSKATITRLNSSDLNSEAKKDFDKSEWSDDGKLTILFRFPEDPKCEPDGDNCKLYYKVDFDGDGNEYLPTLYTIDYSEVTFKKNSLVKLEPVTSGTIDGEEWKGFTESDNYKVQFDEESSNFKVTGLITIFNDEDWSGSNNPFNDASDYYLAFKLSKAEVGGENPDTIVKFLTDGDGHGETNTIGKGDFNKNKSIYVLKYLNPNKDYGNKKFTITIDFDDAGDEYKPYTITIDWSELDFQYESGVASTVVVDPNAKDNTISRGYISEQNKQDITNYGYDFTNVGNIQIANEGSSGYKLTGTVKEQNVESAGFKEPTGYYVPIKIYGPTIVDANRYHFLSQADGRKKWTIYLRNEDGTYKEEITPSKEDYENGYIVVLFKLKTGIDNKITYKIDWDSSKSDVFLEKEITINYGELGYQALNKITYNYKDAEGKEQNESVEVYQNEETTLKDISSINSDYRKFDGWYKSDNTKVETLTISDDKDETLTAHWKLDAELFVKSLVEDLNKKDGNSEKFELTVNDDNVVIDVIDSRLLLSDMNNTTIPGAIAYLLQKGEIKEITLTFDGHSKTFNKDGVKTVALDSELKDKIKEGAKALFKEVLSEDEATYTLSKMALNNKEFTLGISSNDETVTFVDDSKKDYTFKFESESYTVTNEEELKRALENNKITHIYLGSDFEVQKQYQISRPVVINGGKYHKEGKYKISLQNGKESEFDSIFKVTSSGVTIDNIELSGGKNAVIVEGKDAELKTTGLTLSNIKESGIKTITGTVSATDVTFEGETHDIPTAKVVRPQSGQKIDASVSIDNSTQNDPIYIGVTKHDELWCADEGNNYGKEDSSTLKNCKLKSRSDDYDSTFDTYYYINSANKKDYVIVNFMESFAGGTMGLSKIYEKGQKIDTFAKYIGEVKVTDSKTGKEYYFVGYGTGRKTTSDITSGEIYFKNLMDLTTEKAEDGKWHFAYYVERDDAKNVSLDATVKLEGYDSSTKYYTYKFTDKQDGMTIGDLKKLDSKFAEMWQKLEAKAKSESKAIKYEKDGEEQDVTDETVISEAITLKLGSSSIEKP